MNFADSNHRQKEKMIRRTMSSGLNLLLIASFIAAPTSVIFLPTLSSAHPLPFAPLWMSQIVDSLRHGRLLGPDIDTLVEKDDDSYQRLVSIINRINHLAAQQKLHYRLKVRKIPLLHTRLAIKVSVVDVTKKEEKVVAEYDVGSTMNDIGKAPK